MLKVGDTVRIVKGRYKNYLNKTGEITAYDDGDNSFYVELDDVDFGDWFYLDEGAVLEKYERAEGPREKAMIAVKKWAERTTPNIYGTARIHASVPALPNETQDFNAFNEQFRNELATAHGVTEVERSITAHGLAHSEITGVAKLVFKTPKQWEPTEQDYRECCGIWLTAKLDHYSVTPDTLLRYPTRRAFDVAYKAAVKVEPIPEQEIPKPTVPKESYNIAYPTLHEFLTKKG